MAQFINYFDVDLWKPMQPQQLRSVVSEGDVRGLRVGAVVTSKGTAVDLGGQCIGKVIRADGASIQLTGYINQNIAYVVLDQQCCVIEGPIQVAVCWVSGGDVTTLVIGYGTVVNTVTGTAVQPSTPIPDLTQLLAEIQNMRTATAAANAAATNAVANFAGAFNPNRSYTVGQYITGDTNGKFYRFIKDHSGAWNSEDVVEVTTGDDLLRLRSALDITLMNFAKGFSTTKAYTTGDYVTGSTSYKFYRFIQNYSGAWDSSKLTETTVGDELLSLKRSLGTAINTAVTDLAKPFDPNETYVVGDYVTGDMGNKFYRFKVNHSGPWSSARVDETTVGDQLKALKNALDAAVADFTGEPSYDHSGYLRLDGGAMLGPLTLSTAGLNTASTAGFTLNSYGNFIHRRATASDTWSIIANDNTAKITFTPETGAAEFSGEITANSGVEVNSGRVWFKNRADSTAVSFLRVDGTTNRLELYSEANHAAAAYVRAAGSTYYERYSLPAPNSSLSDHKYYNVLSTKYFQRGTVAAASINASAAKTGTVTFTQAYTNSIPVVVATPYGGDAGSDVTVGITAITKTNFSYAIYNASASAKSIGLTWMAYADS